MKAYFFTSEDFIILVAIQICTNQTPTRPENSTEPLHLHEIIVTHTVYNGSDDRRLDTDDLSHIQNCFKKLRILSVSLPLFVSYGTKGSSKDLWEEKEPENISRPKIYLG